jgi:hypothetical protein
LENITGTPYNQSLTDVIGKLDLNYTFLAAPDPSLGIIPGDIYSTEWYISLGEELPYVSIFTTKAQLTMCSAGGMFSSPNDVATLGRAIMKSSLISPAMTRRWLKPATYVSQVHISFLVFP